MKSVIRNFKCIYLLFSNDSCVYNSFGGVQQDLEPIVLKFQSHCLVAAALSGAYPSSLRPSVPVRAAVHFSYVSHFAAPVISASQNNSRDGTDWLTFHLYMLMVPLQLCVCVCVWDGK